MTAPPRRLTDAERAMLAGLARTYQTSIADGEAKLAQGDMLPVTAQAARAATDFAGDVLVLISEVVNGRFEGAELERRLVEIAAAGEILGKSSEMITSVLPPGYSPH